MEAPPPDNLSMKHFRIIVRPQPPLSPSLPPTFFSPPTSRSPSRSASTALACLSLSLPTPQTECLTASIENHPTDFSQYLAPFVLAVTRGVLALPPDVMARDADLTPDTDRFDLGGGSETGSAERICAACAARLDSSEQS